MTRPTPALVAALTILAAPLAAEGAVQELTCEVLAACGADGACAPGGTLAVSLAPISTEGTINVVSVSIDGTEAEALQDGEIGALEWTTETASHWLIPSGPSNLVWVSQTIGAAVSAETRLLACTGAG